MNKLEKMLKKVVSMLVAVCLMVAVANIPAYAGVTAVSATKTTDAVLSKTYTTPAAAVKATTAKKTTTTKATAKKATATKKTTAAKTASLTTQIIKKYTKQGLTALKAVANKLGLKLKTVYNQFVRYGVTKKDMKKVASTLVKLARRGIRFTCCASLAVSKYLGISNKFSAVQNLAADIAGSAKDFVRLHKNERVIIGYASTKTVLVKNGKKAEYCGNISLKEFMSNLKAGQKALLHVTCLNRRGRAISGHAITVKREKNGKYAVYDIMTNGGNKIVYTAKEFKKFLKGKSAKGKTTSGRSVRKPVYYNSTSGVIKYRFVYKGRMSITTDSKNIKQIEIKRSFDYKLAISSVNKLLKTKNLSSFAKTWLTKAKTVINNIATSNKTNSNNESLFREAYFTLHNVSIQNFSIDVLMEETKGVFSPIKSALKNNLTYKIYAKYGNSGIDLVNEISNKYKLSKTSVYNAFVNSGVTKRQMEEDSHILVYQIEKEYDIFVNPWTSNSNLKKALAAIKKLVDNTTTQLAA